MTDVPCPATPQLLALTAACRPDWSSDQVRDVLGQARTEGMTWGHVLVVVAQLIADPDAEPPDLLAARRELWRHRRRPPGPETAHRGAAAVRAALTTRSD
ncbi:hypothetical protein [Streptomyces beihaiensis]|uniref:ANTAR domain-containing protein n=1 Tax=Streptomyces beihaiensis TaxID=2984495 RepID=A0ABT3TRC1_9ACTN|nr:hypothetical protein [Streptomyces beihaiensis]MCX3059602.1 hypothetical protein [Streptomyces beihaiensis]